MTLVGKVRWQGWLVLLPTWVAALVVPVLAASFLHAGTDRRARLVGAVYLIFFLLVGQPFDTYWGLLAWPVWALIFGAGAQEIADCLRTALVAGDAEPRKAVGRV
jgi:hypothetical protein